MKTRFSAKGLLGVVLVATVGVACSPLQEELKQDLDSQSTIYAHSEEDFSDVQGANGWTYGYFEECRLQVQLCHQDFLELPEFLVDNDWWGTGPLDQANATYTLVSATGGHPSVWAPNAPTNLADVFQSSVRRWTSPAASELSVSVELKITAPRDGCGDGVVAYVLLDGEIEYFKVLEANDSETYNTELLLSVKEGSTIDFVIEPRENAFCDTTTFLAQIESL